jgi:hypothetical protein
VSGFFLPVFGPFSNGHIVSQTTIWHEAAKNLHRAMWRNNLRKRLLDVPNCKGLKYLRLLDDLQQLQELWCYSGVAAILVREEYTFTMKRLEYHRPNIGGVVVAGQPGIGTSSLQKDGGHFAHALITCRQIKFFVLSPASPPQHWEPRRPTTRTILLPVLPKWCRNPRRR